MPKDPLLPAVPGEGDSWESLASNLLGINLNKPLDAEIVSAEELAALELDVDFDDPPVETPPPAPDVAPAVSASVRIDDDLVGDSPEEPAASEIEQPESERAADPYWDPLAEWEWDDRPSTKRTRPPQSSTPGERPAASSRETTRPVPAARNDESVVKSPGADARRAADSFDTVSDYRDEYETGDDWEFGAGLLEGVAPPEPKVEAPAAAPPPRAEAAPAKSELRDADGRSERPRREEPRREESRREEPRRERRDSRPPASEERAKPAPPVPPAPSRRPEAKSAAPVGDDDFGAGLVDGDAPPAADGSREDAEEQRRPRRRGRRRGRSSKGDERTEPRADADGTESGPRDATKPRPASELPRADFDDDDEREPADEAAEDSPYRNIPSWEEAISYLTNPKRQSDSRGEPRSSERSESSTSDSGGPGRSGGNSSGRRRRRRPPK